MTKRKRELARSEFTPVFRHFTNLLVNRIVVDNLPEEIDEKFLLYHVLLDGRILFFKKNGKHHVMWFSGKGTLNEYYIQNKYLVVNPWADSTTGDYNESNASILYSDINAYIENADVGLYDFIKDYADIINAIDASIRALAKNCKVIGFITGASNSLVNSAKQMVNSLLNTDNCIGVCEESLVDSIKVNPISTHMDYKFSELVKTRQYYISDFYQKLGIANNQNMKAERLTDNESQLIENVSNIDFNHILDNLNYSVKFINEKFGLNISFRLNEESDEVVNNSGDGTEYTEDETTNGSDELGTEQSEQTPTGENNPANDVSTGSSINITNAIAERVAQILQSQKEVGEEDGRESGTSDVRGDAQPEVQGLPVSAEDDGNTTEGDEKVVNNSEEKEDTEVEVTVDVRINDDEEDVKNSDEDVKEEEDNA